MRSIRVARLRVASHPAVRGELYGDYFHGKLAAGKTGGLAMTAVARKFLKLLWGLERSARAFDEARVFASARAAA